MPDYNKLDDIGFIQSRKPTEEDLKAISAEIAASKKRLALREKRKKARQSTQAAKAK